MNRIINIVSTKSRRIDRKIFVRPIWLLLFMVLCFTIRANSVNATILRVAVLAPEINMAVDENIREQLADIIRDSVGQIEEITLIDKREVSAARNRANLTGCVGDDCARRIGTAADADIIIVSSLTVQYQEWGTIGVRAVDVSTGKVQAQVTRNLGDAADTTEWFSSMKNAMESFSPEFAAALVAGTTVAETEKPPLAAMPDEKILGEMLFVPGATYTMGVPKSADSHAHEVTVSSFWMDRTEVSEEAYHRCILVGGCTDHKHVKGLSGPEQPAVKVSWEQAKAFCEFNNKRLPTEAEWEYAARGIDGRKFPFEKKLSCKVANFSGCTTNGTMPVDSLPKGASPFGMLHMSGNVWEWNSDWYSTKYFKNSEPVDPKGPEKGKQKVVRGGSWEAINTSLRATSRSRLKPTIGDRSTGFRCARDSTKTDIDAHRQAAEKGDQNKNLVE